MRSLITTRKRARRDAPPPGRLVRPMLVTSCLAVLALSVSPRMSRAQTLETAAMHETVSRTYLFASDYHGVHQFTLSGREVARIPGITAITTGVLA